MPIQIILKGLNDLPLKAFGQIYYSEQGELRALQAETDQYGLLSFDDIATWSEMHIVFFGGFWTLMLSAAQLPKELVCPVLPNCGERMWWHTVLGIETPDPTAGDGIAIGVVDTPFAPVAGLEHASVQNLAGSAYQGEAGTIPSHGETVCRLIGQRMDDPTRFGGVAPGAKIFCIDAERDASLNSAVASAAIVKLAREYECDLINLSAGRREPTEGLRQAISEAREYGALCIVAAGNEPDPQVSYPARYPESIAVGAIGLRDWGPNRSYARVLSDWAGSQPDMTGNIGNCAIFHYPKSAYGEGLDVVGPGVGLVIHRGAEPIFDAVGTSFASPLVVGFLAKVLAKSNEYKALRRGPARAAFAERTLRSVCRRTGIGVEREGAGVPRLPAGWPVRDLEN
ncbi:MAG: S8/S53 family peptidase [Xanthobacteraceae bacterium]